MTLAIAIVTGDGVVIAADSRTTVTYKEQRRIASDFTHKVFQAGSVAVATYGEAFIAERSIASHMAEFAAAHGDVCRTPQQTAELLEEFFTQLHAGASDIRCAAAARRCHRCRISPRRLRRRRDR